MKSELQNKAFISILYVRCWITQENYCFAYTQTSNRKTCTQRRLSIYMRIRYIVSIMYAMIMIMINDSLHTFRYRHIEHCTHTKFEMKPLNFWHCYQGVDFLKLGIWFYFDFGQKKLDARELRVQPRFAPIGRWYQSNL